MITEDQLESLYRGRGKKLFTYLEKKHQGGTSNAKGNSFENHFAIFKIADHFNRAVILNRFIFQVSNWLL